MSSIRVITVVVCVIGGVTALGVCSVTPLGALENAALGVPLGVPEVRTDGADSYTFGNNGQLDRYGNQVEEAVGDYRLDGHGEMYELHSPETALPHLGRPST